MPVSWAVFWPRGPFRAAWKTGVAAARSAPSAEIGREASDVEPDADYRAEVELDV